MPNARQVAFEVLLKVLQNNSYSNLLLDSTFEKLNIPSLDRAYISAITYGVIEREKFLDYNLSLYLKQPLKKLKPQVLVILRMGVYQLFFMDKVHEGAAVNESVKLAKNNSCSFASGLVNAVLRNVVRNGIKYPDNKNENYLSIKYSVEKWIVDEWTKHFGLQTTERILKNSIGNVPVYIKVNTLKTSKNELIEKLKNENIKCEEVENFDDALKIQSGGNPANTNCFDEGLFHIQDLSSQICVKIVDAKKNERFLDVCAAPGGKSFSVCEAMENKGEAYSCDIYFHRLKLISDSAKRLGIDIIKTIENDASKPNSDFGLFDKVLCDVPCSGLGIIRRKPEIRYKSKEDIDKLYDLQYNILCVSSNYVKEKGKLIYSTCSLNRLENEINCERFLEEHTDFKKSNIEIFSQYGILEENMLNILPGKMDTDGFFVAVFERK